MSRAGACAAFTALVVAVGAGPVEAYLKLGTTFDGRTLTLRWARTPIRYFVADRGVPEVSASQLRTAAERAFQAWQDVPASSIAFESVGFTSAEPSGEDGVVTIGFESHPELERILGSTAFVVDVITGEIVEADIVLNSAFPWSVAPEGQEGRFDVESIAVHEIGHLIGLGHSLLGETELSAGRRRVVGAAAAMFPIAFSAGVLEGRKLRADDVAGASDLYPASGFAGRLGSVRGRVTREGAGVLGAHVVALATSTGALVGGFTLTAAGDFVVAGLEPGTYILRVEPLDDAAPESFFSPSVTPDTDFGVAYGERLAFVPAGGTGASVDIRVRSR